MGMTLTNDFKAHITVENMKSSMLTIFMEMFEEQNATMDDDAKDYLLLTTERLMIDNGMDSSMSVAKYKSAIDTDGEKEYFVKMDEFDEVTDLFRKTVAKLMIQVVSYELSEYLAEREKEK